MPVPRAEQFFPINDLAGGVTKLSAEAISGLRSVTAREIADVCVQALVDQPRKQNEVRGRAVELIGVWAADDPARRADLFPTLATSPPYVVDTQEESARDWSLHDLLEDVFSRDELLAGLGTFQSVVASPSLPDLTGIRRAIPALRGKMRTGREEISVIEDETERRRVTSVLMPFLDLPASALGGYELSSIAEIIIGMTPENASAEIADDIWWLGLLSNNKDEVYRRAVERISSWIDAHDDEELPHISGPLQQIPLDYEHREI